MKVFQTKKYEKDPKDARVFSPLMAHSIPFYGLLRTQYRQWVPLFVRWENAKEKVEALEVERAEIERLPEARVEFLVRVKKEFDGYSKDRVARLRKSLAAFQTTTGRIPFLFRSLRNEIQEPGILLTWAELESAISGLPEGISGKDREKRLEKVDRSLSELKADLDACRPQSRYLFNESKVVCDAWAAFVDEWRGVQERLNAPGGPTGREIGLSDDDEAWAWKELKLREYVNARGEIPTPRVKSMEEEIER